MGRFSGGNEGGLLRVAERTGIRKGMAGNKPWFYVGTGLWTLRTIRRMAQRKTEILLSETLEPGQRIVISNDRATIEQLEHQGGHAAHAQASEKQTRKERKAERKDAKRAAKKATEG